MRRQALSVLGVALLAFAAPFLAGRVAYPHDNTVEVGLLGAEPLGPPSARKLSDATHYYLPALEQQLRGDRSGWLSLWDPHAEMGRPSVQHYGLGKAFLPVHVLSWLSDDALRVYTWTSVLAVVLGCAFAYLLFESLGLHPLASATAALGVGIGCLTMYSNCFTNYLWGVTWTTALFWIVTRFVERPSLAWGLAAAFCTNALLLSGYPQFVVWQAYLLAAYALWRLARRGEGVRAAVARGARLAGWAIAGALAAAPVYWDLLATARASTRLAFDREFFAAVLPDLGSLAGAGAFVASALDATLFGVPAAQDYPAKLAEPFLLPLWAGLAAASVGLGEWRRVWPLHLFTGAALVLTVSEELYLFAVRTFGLGLSRTVPLRLAHLPVLVLAALTADRALRGTLRSRRLGAAAVLAAAAVAAVGAGISGLPVDAPLAAFSAATALGTAAFVYTGSGRLLLGLALASGLVYGLVLPVSRARGELRLDSPLVELVRKETEGGFRFAWCGSNLGDVLAPNQEGLYGLASIHAYDPLFSARYQRWAARYRKTQVRGTHDRRFLSVIRLEEFLAESAAPAGVRVLLSTAGPVVGGLAEIGRFGPIGVYRPSVAAFRERRLARFEHGADGEVRAGATGGHGPELAVRRVLDEDETKRFELAPQASETLLLVGQQYHRGWRARAAERPLETVAVDGVFQGVLVPPGTSEVELAFTCAARWSWIPQVAFAAAAAALALARLKRASGGR